MKAPTRSEAFCVLFRSLANLPENHPWSGCRYDGAGPLSYGSGGTEKLAECLAVWLARGGGCVKPFLAEQLSAASSMRSEVEPVALFCLWPGGRFDGPGLDPLNRPQSDIAAQVGPSLHCAGKRFKRKVRVLTD